MLVRLVLILLLGVCAPAFAQQVPNRFAATLVPAESFNIGATLVERHGQDGTPLILVPGLASGAWTWQDTIRRTMNDHVVYVLTLPGFDGRPAVAGKGYAAAQDSLRELIETRKLRKPVLVGHGLGGTLALGVAALVPDLVGGVVLIDALPVMAGTEDWPPEQRAQIAGAMAARMPSEKPAMYAAQQQQYMRGMGVIDVARADELAKLMNRSDPAAANRYMVDGFAIDLRPALPTVKAPVLVIAPYFDLDAMQQQTTLENKTEYYRTVMKGTPNLKVVAVSPARHFAMFDQPQAVNDAINNFLKALAN